MVSARRSLAFIVSSSRLHQDHNDRALPGDNQANQPPPSLGQVSHYRPRLGPALGALRLVVGDFGQRFLGDRTGFLVYRHFHRTAIRRPITTISPRVSEPRAVRTLISCPSPPCMRSRRSPSCRRSACGNRSPSFRRSSGWTSSRLGRLLSWYVVLSFTIWVSCGVRDRK